MHTWIVLILFIRSVSKITLNFDIFLRIEPI
jgi:hypothetical protein